MDALVEFEQIPEGSKVTEREVSYSFPSDASMLQAREARLEAISRESPKDAIGFKTETFFPSRPAGVRTHLGPINYSGKVIYVLNQ